MSLFLKTSGVFLILVLMACSGLEKTAPPELRVLSWNVQNLFDSIKDGGEYPEFDPENSWSEADYRKRLDTLGGIIGDSCPGGPEIVLLQELENERVAQDLGRSCGFPYPWIFYSPLPGGTTRVAVLSRLPFLWTGILAPGDPGVDGRAVLEVAVTGNDGTPIILMCNHWKSRIPTREATEAARAVTAGLVRDRVLAHTAHSCPVIVAGDFNSWPTQQWGAGLGRPGTGVLRISTEPGDLAPLWEPREPGGWNGTYWFRDLWEPLDHFFLTPDFSQDQVNLRILRGCEVTDSLGRPRAWNPETAQGVSDHLPVLLCLRLD